MVDKFIKRMIDSLEVIDFTGGGRTSLLDIIFEFLAMTLNDADNFLKVEVHLFLGGVAILGDSLDFLLLRLNV